MSRRHSMRPGDWESIVGRLQELVLANSGEDEFEEIFKLLVAKLLDEVRCEGGSGEFRLLESPDETAANINSMIAQASVRWRGILPGAARSRLTNEHLAICVEALQQHSLLDTNLEVLDSFFEFLVGRVAKGAKGQYFTPRHVIDCCVRILDPKPDEMLADPACGSGGFLVHSMNHVAQYHVGINLQEYADAKLWGFDFDHRAVRVAKTLMLIAGDGSSNIFRVNSLLTPALNVSMFNSDADSALTIEDAVRLRSKGFRGFDVIMTNPPFAGEVRETHLLESYELARAGRRIERDVLFLERCVNLLRPGGRIAIVLPHNKFGAESWSFVREWLLRHLRVVGVVGLGRNTFLPHTHQKTSVLFGIRRHRPTQRLANEKILFVISEKPGKDSRGAVVPRTGTRPDDALWVRADHDLEEVVSQFAAFRNSAGLEWGEVA